MVKSAQSVATTFTIHNPTTGADAAPDALPTAVLMLNGTANAAVVTVATAGATGRYKATVTLPALAAGDVVEVIAIAIVGGITASGKVWSDVGVTKWVSELQDITLSSIWDRLLTSIVTSGSVGKLIKDNLNVAVDTRATPTQVLDSVNSALNDTPPGVIIPDSIWDILSNLSDGSVLDQDASAHTDLNSLGYWLNRMASGSVKMVVPITQGGRIDIYRTYDYNVGESRQIDISEETDNGQWGDLTGATVNLHIDQPSGAKVTIAGTVVTPNTFPRKVRFQPTAVQTASLTAPSNGYSELRSYIADALNTDGRLIPLAAEKVNVHNPIT